MSLSKISVPFSTTYWVVPRQFLAGEHPVEIRRHGTATEQDVIAQIAELRSLMPGGREASPHTPEQVQLVKNWKAGS